MNLLGKHPKRYRTTSNFQRKNKNVCEFAINSNISRSYT